MTWQGENYCCEWIPKLAFQELSLCQSDEGWKLKTSAFFFLTDTRIWSLFEFDNSFDAKLFCFTSAPTSLFAFITKEHMDTPKENVKAIKVFFFLTTPWHVFKNIYCTFIFCYFHRLQKSGQHHVQMWRKKTLQRLLRILLTLCQVKRLPKACVCQTHERDASIKNSFLIMFQLDELDE